MYIEEIILDGFKSYATRTVISGWDAQFNAITGLNGTGKSNILDAICFILGIDNLKQVRASNLQDLIYKHGQAGITKASVTAVFNNSDPGQSPIGFADQPQITIVLNGKSKYLVNGHVAQQKAVENLFQSVQLNVNNPHFLIMQGQIMRVLNMKPPEILAMIEESAGTRMFEDRKGKAISTLDKKEHKVAEIGALLTDVIEPKLNALRSERSDFMEYRRVESDMERLQRVLKAHTYMQLQGSLRENESRRDRLQGEVEELSKEQKAIDRELEQLADHMLNLTKRRQKEGGQHSQAIRQLEEECKQAANNVVRLWTQIELKQQGMALEEKTLQSNRERHTEETDRHKVLLGKLEKIAPKYEEINTKHIKAVDDLRRDEDLLRSLETGLAGRDGSTDTGYVKLLNECRDRISAVRVEIQQAELRTHSLSNELTKLEPETKKARREGAEVEAKSKSLREQIKTLEQTLNESVEGASEGEAAKSVESHESEGSLLQRRASLEGEVSKLQAELEELQSAIANIQFRYSPPSPHFDPAKVKGVVAELVKLDEKAIKYSTALEIAAGGRLYNVVVEDADTATSLLDKGRLSRRVTIIPLNKIVPKELPASKLSEAERATHGKAKVALSLVGYAKEVEAAIKFVFGGTFVCDDKEAASMIAFDRRFMTRAVTTEGDLYEPTGTLSGGATPSLGGAILTKLSRYRELGGDHERIVRELRLVNQKLASFETGRRRRLERENELKAKQQELLLLTRHFEASPAGRLLARVESISQELAALSQSIEKNKQIQKTAETDYSRYEEESCLLANDRDGQLAALARRTAETKARISKEEKIFKRTCDEYQTLKAEIAASEVAKKDLGTSLEELTRSIMHSRVELETMHASYAEAITCHNGLKIRADGKLGELRRFDEELERSATRKKECEGRLESMALDHEKMTKSLKQVQVEMQAASERIKEMLKQEEWMEEAKSHFGVTGSSYDFSQYNMSELANRVRTLEEQHGRLRKTINFNVMDMIDRVEAKEGSLKQMLATVKKDRSKIETTISKLNDYKLRTLEKTWRKVNEDFGQIFGELLPQSSAKLDLLEGKPISEGLEIKVCLGGVWKQSLTELSGGQRSLVALSLILALLQFKPAPMYILDEVDAALDLSHTENIGRLLKNRFKGSQFIVVSLKEGMFTNANVLFRTRFRDGVSKVERIAKKAEDPVKKDLKIGRTSVAHAHTNSTA